MNGRAGVGGIVAVGLSLAATVAVLGPGGVETDEGGAPRCKARFAARADAAPTLREVFQSGARTPARAAERERTLRLVLLELAAADRSGDDAARARLLAQLRGLSAAGWREVLATLATLRGASSLAQALRLIEHLLPTLQARLGAELAARLRPLLEAGLAHGGAAHLCTSALRLWAEVDPPGFRAQALRSVARADAGLGLLDGVVATLEQLAPTDQQAALGSLAATQLRAGEADGDSPETAQRRALGLAAARAVVARADAADLLRLLDDDGTPSEVRAVVAAAAAHDGTLRELVVGPFAARLAETLTREVLTTARGLDPSASSPPGLVRRLQTLAALPPTAARAALLDVLEHEPRLDVAHQSARLLAATGGLELPGAILARMRSAAPSGRARLDLAEALLSIHGLDASVRAPAQVLLAESVAFAPPELQPRARALAAVAASGQPLRSLH